MTSEPARAIRTGQLLQLHKKNPRGFPPGVLVIHAPTTIEQGRAARLHSIRFQRGTL